MIKNKIEKDIQNLSENIQNSSEGLSTYVYYTILKFKENENSHFFPGEYQCDEDTLFTFFGWNFLHVAKCVLLHCDRNGGSPELFRSQCHEEAGHHRSLSLSSPQSCHHNECGGHACRLFWSPLLQQGNYLNTDIH